MVASLLITHGRCTQLASPVVFLPGLTCNERLWHHVVGALVDQPRATAASHQTQCLPPSSSVGAPVFSADSHHTSCLDDTAAALLESLPHGPLSVVGHSLGGYLAMAMLRKASPGRIDRLALISTQPRADTPAIQLRRRDLMAKVRRSGPLAGISPSSVLLGKVQRDDVALWSVMENMASEVGVERFVCGCTAAMNRVDSRNTLRAIIAETTPVLLIVGAEDAITPVATTREMSSLIPHAKVTVLPDCGHMAPLERPDDVSSALVDFLS